MRPPKRVCADYRSVLVERNSYTSTVKDRFIAFNNLNPNLPPPLQSALARCQPQSQDEAYINNWHHIISKLSFLRLRKPSLLLTISPNTRNGHNRHDRTVITVMIATIDIDEEQRS